MHTRTAPVRHATPRAMLVTILTISSAALGAASLPRPGEQPSTAAAKPQSFECISKPSDTRELGFSTRGTIAELLVKPGDQIKMGDALARLDDRVQARYVDLAALAASDDSQLQLAERTVAFRGEEMKMIESARDRVAGNAAEVRDARYKLETSEIELAAAKFRRESDRITLERERARLGEMRIASPIAATVIEVHKRAGETVDQGTTVVTLVNIDPLWLEVNVPTGVALSIGVGSVATVIWEDVKGLEPMRGRVIYRSPAAHAGARQIQLRVELPNPNQIPSGMHGTVRFDDTETSHK